MIKTHKNSDGTYDASINGQRLGLHCVFAISARVTAKVVLTKALSHRVSKVSLDDSTEMFASRVVPLSVFVNEVSRPGFSFRMDRYTMVVNRSTGGRGAAGYVYFKGARCNGFWTFEIRPGSMVTALCPRFGF